MEDFPRLAKIPRGYEQMGKARLVSVNLGILFEFRTTVWAGNPVFLYFMVTEGALCDFGRFNFFFRKKETKKATTNP